MKDSNDTGKLIGALLLGAAIGGVLGVLFAPDKGTETRKKLMKGATDFAEDLKNKIQHEAKNHMEKAEEVAELS